MVGRRIPGPGPWRLGVRTLTEGWDGRTWSIIPSADPGIDNDLTGVVALDRDEAWAVGWSTRIDRSGGSFSVPLIERWDGRRWSVAPTPDIGARTGTLAAIAAGGGHGLWAVGSRTVRVGSPELALALHYTEGEWSAVPMQDAPGRYDRLTAVTAAGPYVWAVGLTLDPAGSAPNATLIERIDPLGGRIAPSPDPWKGGNELYGVAAHGPDGIWAVGDGWRGTTSVPLTVHFDGRSWRAVERPRAGPSGTLLGIAQTVGEGFWAVGFRTSKGVRRPLIERWTGNRWVLGAAPSPHPNGDLLSAVATVPGGRAMAVGNGIGLTGYARTLVVASWRDVGG